MESAARLLTIDETTSAVDEYIDSNVLPKIPRGFYLYFHEHLGVFSFERLRKICAHIAVCQHTPGANGASGPTICSELTRIKTRRLINATILDWLLDRPWCIHEYWKNFNAILFWGTTLIDTSSVPYVMGMRWENSSWHKVTVRRDNLFDDSFVSAILDDS